MPRGLYIVNVSGRRLAHCLSHITLSSITRNTQRVNCRTTGLLRQLLSGRRVPLRQVLIPPIHIVRQHSASCHSLASPTIVRTVRCVHGRTYGKVGISRMLSTIKVSHSGLRGHFGRRINRAVRTVVRTRGLRGTHDLLVSAALSVGRVSRVYNCPSLRCFCSIFGGTCSAAPGRCHSMGDRIVL